MNFDLTQQPIDTKACVENLNNAHAGACVSFEGWVRNHNDGRSVDFLEYEAFGPMALGEGERILAEAEKRFDVTGLHAVHRVGTLRIGELAIWVGAASAHRQEAFLACRWVMDRIKEHVPVWKKEHYTDGPEPIWVGAGVDSVSGIRESWEEPYYSRQVTLPQVGVSGQKRLAESRVVVVGAGGLGCPALMYLASAGVGQIVVIDGDRVDESNLHRQTLFGSGDIGLSKASVAADRLRAQNPHISVQAIAEHFGDPRVVSTWGADVVLDCTDSFESKYLLADACWDNAIPLVQAAIYQFDGQIQVFVPGEGCPCFRCLWPEPPPAGCVGNCAEAGILEVTAGLFGILQATECLKLILGLPEGLSRHTLWFDVLSGR